MAKCQHLIEPSVTRGWQGGLRTASGFALSPAGSPPAVPVEPTVIHSGATCKNGCIFFWNMETTCDKPCEARLGLTRCSRGGGGGEEVLARGSPVQRALEVWGALEGSGPTFQGSSWIPCGRRAADGSRGWKEARDPLASSRACGRLGVTGELGTGRPGDPQSQPFAHPAPAAWEALKGLQRLITWVVAPAGPFPASS